MGCGNGGRIDRVGTPGWEEVLDDLVENYKVPTETWYPDRVNWSEPKGALYRELKYWQDETVEPGKYDFGSDYYNS